MDKAVEAARKAIAANSDDDCRYVPCSVLTSCQCHKEALAAITAADEARAVTDEEVITKVYAAMGIPELTDVVGGRDFLESLHAAGFKVMVISG